MRRMIWLVTAALALGPSSLAKATPNLCVDRLLVLSAYPGEIDMLLTSAEVTAADVVHAAEGRTFYLGHLGNNDVALALSGIGLVNAERTTQIALETFVCGPVNHITGIVFSGVAGGPNIGDVMVPGSWRVGHETFRVDSDMFSVAQAAAATVTLPSAVPPGDVACIGVDPRAATTVAVTEAPQIRFAADKLGFSADGFGDRAFPCIPGGGDVFGCRPCRAPDVSAPDVQRFATGVIPFVDPNFFSEYGTPPAPDGTIAVDMETGAVAKVAAGALRPFIAFRGASDGNGDPLMLPGFPFQFFVYRQLAADNAARVTLAFLDAWAGA